MNEPNSYWHATANTAPIPTVDLPRSAEVVVIGGGIHGVSIAYWLARSGAHPLVIERGALASGATGRNGGLMVVGAAESFSATVAHHGHQRARTIYQMTIENQHVLRAVLAEEAIDAGYRKTGHLQISLEDEFAQARAEAEQLNAEGFTAELRDRTGVQELITTPLGDKISGGLFLPDSGTVHSARFVAGIAQAAQRHGARFCTGIAVEQLATNTQGVTLTTSGGVVNAPRVIVATNAWTGQLLPTLAKRVTPVRGQALAYAPCALIFATGCSASLTPTGEYWQQTADGSIVIGGCRAVAPDGDVGVWQQTPSEVVQQAIEGILPRLFPQLPQLNIAQRWAGLMAFTADHTPIAGPLPDLPGVWVVGGFSGHGMPFSMTLDRLLADSALADRPDPALALFGI